MDAKTLFSKTMPFVWAKLGIGLLFVVIVAFLFPILVGLGWLFGEIGTIIMFCVWVGSIKFVHLLIMNYGGYLLKAGHVAVIQEIALTGNVPLDQVNYGKGKVLERFITTNTYFAIDQLVRAAIKEVQKGIGKISDVLDFIPGIQAVEALIQYFVSVALGTIDECCLGWTFAHPTESAFKTSADGIVIYVQNWQTLLKKAFWTVLKTLALCVIIAILIFIPIGLLFKLFHWNGLVAFLIACCLAWVIKFALLDSYIMIQMMSEYMAVAPSTTLAFDLYQTLCEASTHFKQLFEQGVKESNTTNQNINSTSFCPSCGTQNVVGTKYCSECGQKMEG